MKSVQEIYDAYRIMPGLQLHQLRVGAVGKLIAESFDGPLGIDSVVLACLFHDMGNIAKSDLQTFPEFLGESSFEYWSQVKKECAVRYGSDAHAATIAMGREIGLPERVIAYMDAIGFSRLENIRDTDSFETKIIEYSDMRVAPHGVRSMHDRLEDARERYASIPHNHDMPEDRPRYNELYKAAKDMERQIFARTSIRAEDITEASIQPLIPMLREYKVA